MNNNMNHILQLWSQYIESTITESSSPTEEKQERESFKRRINLITQDELDKLKTAGKDELDKIGKGLFEDDTIEEGDQCNFNKMHDEEGKFSSKDRPGSWSALTRACKDRGQHKSSAGSSQKGSSSAPCGRKDRSRLCKTGSELKRESLDKGMDKNKRYLSISTLRKILSNIMQQEFQNHYKFVTKNQPKTYCTWNQFLKQQNSLQMAQKGDLNKTSSK